MPDSQIYLNSAATSYPKPDAVKDAVLASLNEMPGRRSAGDEQNQRTVEAHKAVIADYFGVGSSRNFLFGSNVTYAINAVLLGLIDNESWHVAFSAADHTSIIRPLMHLQERLGIRLSIIPVNEEGVLDLDFVDDLLKRDPPDLLLMTHASNVLGNIYDAELIGKMCRNSDCLFGLDASQTAGQFKIAFEALGADFVFFTGHKSLLGPTGVGAAYILQPDRIQPVMTGGTGKNSRILFQPSGVPERFEAGTPNDMSLAGLAAGISHLKTVSYEEIHSHKHELRSALIRKLRATDGITMYGTRDAHKAAVLSFNIDHMLSKDVAKDLLEEGVVVRGGLHCAPLMHKAIGTFPNGTVRVSFGPENTMEEVERFHAIIASMVPS